MGERKVLNRYVPPDFDPSLIPKFKRAKNTLIEVRMMLPFSLRCNTCGEYMYMGKKFNSRSEIIKGEDYMGIRKFRFYIKCCVCSAEITFKTDPKNSGYECESGASRNFEMWRETEEEKEAVKKQREQEDEADAMKALENRTMESKLEMDVLDALDEIKAINQRHERIDTNKLIEALQKPTVTNGEVDRNAINKATGITLADEDLIKSIKFKNKPATINVGSNGGSSSGGSGNNNDALSTTHTLVSQLNKHVNAKQAAAAAAPALNTTILIKKRKIDPPVPAPASTTEPTAAPSVAESKTSNNNNGSSSASSALGGLLMSYDDDYASE